jgi:uncharacterized membrane protein (GlpM family)
MGDYLLRFLIGGAAVSLFAVLGDVLRPKSFAGLFGAAPSIAICTLALALTKEGPRYVASEGRSMVIGATALVVYCVIVCQLLQRLRFQAISATAIALLAWFAVAAAVTPLLPI